MARQYKRSALAEANKARKAMGLPPAKKLYPGVPHSPKACAITSTIIDDDFDVDRYYVSTGSFVTIRDRTIAREVYWEPLAVDALDFTARFDNGKYPELVILIENLPERLGRNYRG